MFKFEKIEIFKFTNCSISPGLKRKLEWSTMSIMLDALTPPRRFPRQLTYWTEDISYLGNPLGGVDASDMIN